MSDTLTKVGQCSGITEKPNGWTEFEIQVQGLQYPVRLSTKIEQLIEDARATKGALATWTYAESEGNINPKSGKPYINRYLESVVLGDTSGGNDLPSPEPHHDAVHFADKDRLITRQTCLKAASNHPGDGIDDWAEAVIEAAARFETWLYRDIDDVPF